MKKKNLPFWLRIFRTIDIVTLLITTSLFLYSWLDSGNLIDKYIPSGFSGQTLYAIYTAILTAIVFTLYTRLQKAIKNREFVGHWGVLKFDGLENYILSTNYVIISEGDDSSTLYYYEEDTANLNSSKGIIYIDPSNSQTGELIETLEYLNQTSTIYPTTSYKIFFDSKTYLSKFNEPIIRILDHNGKEKLILQRPTDQTKFKNYIHGKLSTTMEHMATPIEDILKQAKQ